MTRFDKVMMGDAEKRLMLEIGEAITNFAKHTPITKESVVGILAFCTGATIIQANVDRSARRRMKDMAVENIEHGMTAMQSAKSEAASSIILPEQFQ